MYKTLLRKCAGLCMVCALFCISFAGKFIPHPLKLTTTMISWNEKEKCADVSIRVFFDDFQDKLNKEYNSRYNVKEFHEGAEVRKQVSTFFKSYISISINGKSSDWQCIASEINKDMNTLTFSYKIKGIVLKKKNTAVLENKLLLKYFPTQVNVMRLQFPSVKEELMINFKEGFTAQTIVF